MQIGIASGGRPRGRSLIPPAATDITPQQDLLDHYATYTISERGLDAFLNERSAGDGVMIDSFNEDAANPQ